jgi:hypothetical protein
MKLWRKRKVVPRLEKFYGQYAVAIVGESHYQDALESICGRTEASADLHYVAQVILEDDNPYDDKAVRVEIQNKKVGYLSRQDARAYRRWLAKEHPGVDIICCEANVRGGWDRGRGDRGHFGVWLDLPPALVQR